VIDRFSCSVRALRRIWALGRSAGAIPRLSSSIAPFISGFLGTPWQLCAVRSSVHLNMEPPSSPLPIRTHCKRQFEHLDDVTVSSDTPVFSSDPPDAAIDSDRRKRQYVGTWWHHNQSLNKTDLRRNFDSGVFIPSDDALPTPHHPATIERAAINCPPSSQPPPNRYITAVAAATAIIQDALEEGCETIDLS
jgi:hypothetical protein